MSAAEQGTGEVSPAAEEPAGGEAATAAHPGAGAEGTGGSGSGRRPGRLRRRLLKGFAVALLIGVPGVYGAIAAMQSRDGDGDLAVKAGDVGLAHERPSALNRRIFQVPVPYNASRVGYYESNSWRTSSLYVQFTTTGGGLGSFLAQLGTSRSALRDGRVTITGAQAAKIGWTFRTGHHWAGLLLSTRGTAPSHRITVNLDNPDRPAVYVVSTTHFS